MELNMTKGSPFRLILKFILPALCGNLFYQSYNMVDTIIVGQCLGPQALAAVGATGSISFMVFGFVNGLSAGFTIPIAQSYGEGNLEQMKGYIGNAALLDVIITCVMTAVSVAGIPWLLTVMRVPEDIYEMSRVYITVVCAGMFGNVFYTFLKSILRAVGNSKVPLYFLILSAILNIALDFMFILLFGMGVEGAALATVFSQLLSALLCAWYIARKVPVLQVTRGELRLDEERSRIQIRIGIPMALQYSITALGTMITQTALNTFGSMMISSYVVAGKIEQVINQPYDALGATMATYSAQNYGSGDVERVRRGCRAANLMSIGYSIVIFVLINLLLPYIVPLFVGEDIETVTQYARIYILIGTGFFIPLGMIHIFRNTLQGCGYGVVPMLGGAVELLGRSLAAGAAVYFSSFIGVCSSNASAWLCAGIYFLIAYMVIINKVQKKSLQAACE